jgi:ribose 5-phosphate isomerase B
MEISVIHIGSDHAGFELKSKLITYLNDRGFQVLDHGTHSDESTDYPDYAHPVAESVESDENAKGILICGSGNGISITANKHQGVRCALSWLPEIAELARQHNDANIVSIPSRFVEADSALKIVEVFLGTEFEGGRHERRVNKIACE